MSFQIGQQLQLTQAFFDNPASAELIEAFELVQGVTYTIEGVERYRNGGNGYEHAVTALSSDHSWHSLLDADPGLIDGYIGIITDDPEEAGEFEIVE